MKIVSCNENQRVGVVLDPALADQLYVGTFTPSELIAWAKMIQDVLGDNRVDVHVQRGTVRNYGLFASTRRQNPFVAVCGDVVI